MMYTISPRSTVGGDGVSAGFVHADGVLQPAKCDNVEAAVVPHDYEWREGGIRAGTISCTGMHFVKAQSAKG